MKRTQQFLITGLLLVSGSLQAVELYVSPAGNDSSSGEQAAPLASLEGARVRIETQKLAGKEPVTVWVQGGTYSLTEPFHLGAQDSGTQSAPIVYRAVPGSAVVLKGSLPLSSKGWKSYKDGIYQQSLKGTALEGKEINQLFMSDKRMIRARYPNWDFENPLRTGKGYLHAGGSEKASTKKIEWQPGTLDDRVGRWTNPQDGIVHAFHNKNWGNFQFRIESIDAETRYIYFSEGGWQAQRRYGVGVKSQNHPGSPFYVENIFEELDAELEWFQDVENQILYFKPPADVNLNEVVVEAAILDRIIECVGVEHVSFEGFHLTQTRATFMNEYEDIARGDWAIHRGGAVYFKDSQNCSVKNFHIEQVGGTGIFVDGFNREVHISGSLIENTGESAVCFVGSPKAVREYQTWETWIKTDQIKDLEPGPKTEDYPRDCSVKNTITRDVGVYGKQTSGVLVSMAMDITIDHCSVYRIARAGVTFNDGTWGGHEMSNCDIYDTILDTGEHGPFNSWGRERFWDGKRMTKEWVMLDSLKPVVLRNNRVGNYRSGVSAGNWTIDLDDGSSNYEIYNNLMLGSTLKLRDGFFRKVTNNIMVSAVPTGLHVWPKDNSEDVFMHNITVLAGGAEGGRGRFDYIIGDIGMPSDIGMWGTFDSNLWWNVNSRKFAGRGGLKSFEQWQEKQGKDSILADPQFVDPLNRNYQVKPTSPALKLGFKNFPMDQFGHQMTRIMNSLHEFENECLVEIRPDARGGEVRYTLDGSEPTVNSALYTKPVKITQTTTVTANTFDEQGHAVGFADRVDFARVDQVVLQSWLASTIAQEYVAPVLAKAEKKQAVESKPMNWAGMTLVSIADYPDHIDASGGQASGAYITQLDSGSAAEQAGLKEGDTLIAANGKDVDTLKDLQNVLNQKPKSITCKVFRGYKHYEFTIQNEQPGLSRNPILKNTDPGFLYAADPSAEVFDGKVYVYCSRDQPDAKSYKSMQDYMLLESSDLKTWINHGVFLKPREFDWAYEQMNAPDAAYKDGWYYFYFPFYRWKIGVVRSRTPVGPWEQFHKQEITEIFDPTVFVDDDGQAYMYGSDLKQVDYDIPGKHVMGVKLKDSMIELDGEWTRLTNETVAEGVHVFKRNGIYYFHARVGGNTEYWMADSPLPQFAEYKGVLAPNSPKSPNHASVIEFNGKWYFFYHRGDVNGGSNHRRSACFEEMTFRDDGTIEPIEYTMD
ncbi:family 43 glycosylhydrolase [Pontiellaceae bacterium B1224]|nr:family 43 glycosylhydrolase [Pontiellaceae bacterium B1224]